MSGFTILSQTQRMIQSPAGGFTEAMRITFRTSEGVIASEDIPLALYSVDKVREVLERRAAEIDAVNQIGS